MMLANLDDMNLPNDTNQAHYMYMYMFMYKYFMTHVFG